MIVVYNTEPEVWRILFHLLEGSLQCELESKTRVMFARKSESTRYSELPAAKKLRVKRKLKQRLYEENAGTPEGENAIAVFPTHKLFIRQQAVPCG
ncbi:hypothetical protein J6590_081274 [Homalodisca vitripennis]|nr:hypothetical protein J6590_081274 [Homalodisca vitripennis]